VGPSPWTARAIDVDPQIALTSQLPATAAAAVQRRAAGPAPDDVHAAAARGIAGPSTALPYAEQIQAAFGHRHDVSQIQAHVGGDTAAAMGATAYASGNHVVFDRTPDLHTAAHEAAHVVQQRRGVDLAGGVGRAGDRYEQHADAVADRVVAGRSAADLFGGPAAAAAVPGMVQKDDRHPANPNVPATSNHAHAQPPG
jgi:hypothetical protein